MRKNVVAGLLVAMSALGTVGLMAVPAQAEPVSVSGTLMKGKLCDPGAGAGKHFGRVTITVYATVDSDPQLRHVVIEATTHNTGKKRLLHVVLREESPGSSDTQIGWAWSNKKGKATIHLDYALNTSEDPYTLQVLISKMPADEVCPGNTSAGSYKTEPMELQVA